MTRLEAVTGDLTTQTTDVVVNAANSTLLGGGGVDGALHEAAGPALLEECRRLRHTVLPDGLGVGRAVATGAGLLPARWVVHTVGPNLHRGQQDPALLAAAFTSSLGVAAELGAASVAFPAISAGAYGWPMPQVARIAVQATASAVRTLRSLELIRFVLMNPAACELFAAEIRALAPPPGTDVEA